jgi:hypothetical protein
MSELSLGARNSDRDNRKYELAFWRSTSDSIYLHVNSPHMFDVERWFHFASAASTPRESHEDLVAGMKAARAAWLRHNPPSELLSHGSHDLRAVLARSEAHFDIRRMNNHQVARALFDEVQAGRLIFVPERGEMRKCVQAIKEERQKAGPIRPVHQQQPIAPHPERALHGNSQRMPQNLNASSYSAGSGPLSDAKPLEYVADQVAGDSFDVAKTPNLGDPGTWYTNPGSGQMRLYGDDGKPVLDLDFDHVHNGLQPHAHNWNNGVRDGGDDVVPFSPWSP